MAHLGLILHGSSFMSLLAAFNSASDWTGMTEAKTCLGTLQLALVRPCCLWLSSVWHFTRSFSWNDVNYCLHLRVPQCPQQREVYFVEIAGIIVVMCAHSTLPSSQSRFSWHIYGRTQSQRSDAVSCCSAAINPWPGTSKKPLLILIWSCPGRLDVAANEASWESVQVNGGSDAMLSQAMKQSDNKCVGPTVRDRGWNEPDAFVTPAWKPLPHVWIISQGNNYRTFSPGLLRQFGATFIIGFLCCLPFWDTRPIRAYLSAFWLKRFCVVCRCGIQDLFRRVVRSDWIVFCIVYSCEKQELFRGIIISTLWLMRFCVVCRSGIQDLFGRIL